LSDRDMLENTLSKNIMSVVKKKKEHHEVDNLQKKILKVCLYMCFTRARNEYYI
jgi:hypothetical protein